MNHISEEYLFSGNSEKEVADAFGKEVSRKHLDWLKFWQATAMDDREEWLYMQKRIESEPEIVRINTANKILQIVQQPRKNRQYFKRIGRFCRSEHVIRITQSTGFCDDLCPGGMPKISSNVEYLLDMRNFTIRKRLYSQYTRL